MLRSIRLRLILPVGLAALAPLLALAFFWSQDLRDRALAELGREQANLAEVVGDQVAARLEDIQRLLETAARLPVVRAGGRTEVEALFSRIEPSRIAGGQLLAARRDGVVVAAGSGRAVAPPPSVAAASGFRRAVEARGFGAGDPDPEGPLGRAVVDFWCPVTDEAGGIVRLVGLALEARALAGAWSRLDLGTGGAIVLLGRNGRVVAQAPAGEAGFGRDVSASPLWGDMQRNASGTGEGVLTEDGVRRVFGFRQVAGPSWVLAVGVPPMLAATRALPPLSRGAAGVLALLLAGVGAIAWRVAGNMSRALHTLAAAARRMVAGDYRTPADGAGSGELAAAASDLERIRRRLAEQAGALEAVRAGTPPREPGPGAHDERRAAEPAGRASEIAVFHAVAAAVSPAADAAPAYEPLLAQLLTHLGMDAGALYVVADEGELRLLAHMGHSGAALEAMARLPLGEGIAGRVARDGKPLLVEDASAEARLVRDVVRLEGFHGMAAVPLDGRGRTLGVLELLSRTRRGLGEQELTMLQAVSRHMGLALANAALQEEAERRAARLHTLARLTQSMTASLRPQEVLYLALLAAVQLLEPAYVRVWLWDTATGGPHPGPWHGQGDAVDEGIPESEAWAPEAHVAALAAQGGEPLFIPQVGSDPRCPEPRWWAKRGAASLAALPLSVGERTLGVLTVVPPGPSAFPEEDRELLGLLAGQAAVAFENARLYQGRATEPPEPPVLLEEGPPASGGGAAADTGVPRDARPIAAAVSLESVGLRGRPAVGQPDLPGAAGEMPRGPGRPEPVAASSNGAVAGGAAPEALAALDAAIAAVDDVDLALEVIADEVRPIVGADVAAVLRLGPRGPDGAGRLLRLAAGGLLVTAGAGLDGEAGVVGSALAARAPRAAVAPFGEVGEETLETLALSLGYEAVAAAPILEGEVLAGALAACRRASEPFGAKALQTLAAVAARVGTIWRESASTAGLEGQMEAWNTRH